MEGRHVLGATKTKKTKTEKHPKPENKKTKKDNEKSHTYIRMDLIRI